MGETGRQAPFSTWLLDRVKEREREQRERHRARLLHELEEALARLARKTDFQEAYIFGSVIRPGEFIPGVSDVDVALAGLKDEDFFSVAAFLSACLGCDVDLVQLEGSPLEDRIRREGVRWSRENLPS